LSMYVSPLRPDMVVLVISGNEKYVWRSQVKLNSCESKSNHQNVP
jgi:hypothetical protein